MLKNCPECGVPISDQAETCPACGVEHPFRGKFAHFLSFSWGCLCLILSVIVFFFCMFWFLGSLSKLWLLLKIFW